MMSSLSLQGFLDATPEQLTQVVGTNLRGSLLCMRAALKLMAGQDRGGHIFTMDGAGADGQATPQYAAYGATKAGMPGQCSCDIHLHMRVDHIVTNLQDPYFPLFPGKWGVSCPPLPRPSTRGCCPSRPCTGQRQDQLLRQ